jgi:hypothetical protein
MAGMVLTALIMMLAESAARSSGARERQLRVRSRADMFRKVQQFSFSNIDHFSTARSSRE